LSEVIVLRRERLYSSLVLQTIVRLLTLVAVLIMPFGMAPAVAAPQHAAMAGMTMEHCPDQTPADQGKNAFAECTMACAAALPAIDRQPEERHMIVREPVERLAVRCLHGLHPETAAPPPRTA
jgi:hypothetical protein